MSYKCAVFGHKYGEAEVDHERQEDGEEVIITVRETEACKRCGETRIVSENKEVTRMETAADIVADDLEDDEASTRTDEPMQATDGTSGDSDGQTYSTAETIQEAESRPTSTATTESPPAETTTETNTPAETTTETQSDPVDPEADDGVILDDDDDDEDEREKGEWPGDATEDETTEADDGTEASWELSADIDPHPENERDSESTNGTLTMPEGKFYCPNCEFTTPVESSSLREGDFCPECHKGALEHSREE